ncbi:MAG: tRNA (adenosine(37)-N6)-threonylcarbamoyltransferase complex ATPase subunit type 1 TsaE [Verrucomicrobiales bacterium]|nr:tRNA (adenosine(37)-N6)-threonylcarbamoyltransferase complex ATPase subunit type 1 TsaE [Verrucomicrobiales bacterium]
MHLEGPEDTRRWAKEQARDLVAGDVVALCGDLGAGKTCLSQGLVAGLGSEAAVTSPTFTLVQEYRDGRLPVFHFDFYRLESEAEVLGIGWDDYLDEAGVVLVEWADRFPALLPKGTQWWRITPTADGGREVVTMEAPGES